MSIPHLGYRINKEDAKKAFSEIMEKKYKKEQLSPEEDKYLKAFMNNYYPDLGRNSYSPNYSEKLTAEFEKAANYFITHYTEATRETAIFIAHYFMSKMSNEYGIYYDLNTNENGFDYKSNNAAGVHTSENNKFVGRRGHIGIPSSIFDSVNENKSALFLIMVTAFHEIEHEVQNHEMNKPEVDNYQALIWAKEKIARKTLGVSFYNLNYKNTFYEKDARNESRIRTEKALEDAGAWFKPDISSLTYCSEFSWDVKQKKDSESEETLAIDLLDLISNDAIKSNPGWLIKFPVLNTLYDKQGNKKLITQIYAEIMDRCKKEIAKKPDKKDEIERKYANLYRNVCKTDNELRFQKLCQNAAFDIAENDEIAFRTDIASIKKLLNTRSFEYKGFAEKLTKRIKELNIQINAVLHAPGGKFDQELYKRLSDELSSTKNLKDSVIKYNPDFNKEHEHEQIMKNIEKELKGLLHSDIERYKYVADSSNVYMIEKSEEELSKSYADNLSEIEGMSLNENEIKELKDKLEKLYGSYKDNSQQNPDGTTR